MAGIPRLDDLLRVPGLLDDGDGVLRNGKLQANAGGLCGLIERIQHSDDFITVLDKQVIP